MEKYKIMYLCYDGPEEDKYIERPSFDPSFKSISEAREYLQKIAQQEYELLIEGMEEKEALQYEVDFDGPYDAVVRMYLDEPTDGNRDYINITEYYINTISDDVDECRVAYIDRTRSGSGQHIKFINMHFTEENLGEGCDKAVYYDVTDEFGNEIDGGQMEFNSNEVSYTSIKDPMLIRDVIDFHFDKNPDMEFDVMTIQ